MRKKINLKSQNENKNGWFKNGNSRQDSLLLNIEETLAVMKTREQVLFKQCSLYWIFQDSSKNILKFYFNSGIDCICSIIEVIIEILNLQNLEKNFSKNSICVIHKRLYLHSLWFFTFLFEGMTNSKWFHYHLVILSIKWVFFLIILSII
jgi:hypothetical protein